MTPCEKIVMGMLAELEALTSELQGAEPSAEARQRATHIWERSANQLCAELGVLEDVPAELRPAAFARTLAVCLHAQGLFPDRLMPRMIGVPD